MGNVFIEKVQVEGGFLDGMSLELKKGLNTIIGARGTGKSTFTELIRYSDARECHLRFSNILREQVA